MRLLFFSELLLSNGLVVENIHQCCWLLLATAERRHPGEPKCLTAEAVQGLALALERVHHVHGGHGLAASVLGVGHRVTDHVLEEHLEHTAGLLVDEARDALHATTASETADSGLGDALDVVAQYLAVALGTALAKTLASFTTTGHC